MKNHPLRLWLVALCLSILTMGAIAQNVTRGEREFKKDRLFSDTLIGGKNYKRNFKKSERLYDTLHRSRSGFTRFIAGLLITSPRNTSDAAEAMPWLDVGRHYYSRFEGKKILNVSILQANIFTRDSAEKSTGFGRVIDGIHLMTNERQIRQNLLFKIGDTINPYTMSINEELLRSLPFLATAYIVVFDSPTDPNGVNISIFARDNWSISGDFRWGSDYYISLLDRNFLGSGSELLLRYYFERGDQRPGFEAQYNINNFFGTFADVQLRAGVGATNNVLKVTANRRFILPSDHIWGFTAGHEQRNEGYTVFDSTLAVSRADFGAWYGYSWNLDPKQGTTLYFMLHGAHTQFFKRPQVYADINPFYHNRSTALASIGVSRQNFFQGNMIYGYGRTEDISFGYKAEIVGGIEWGERSGRRFYVGGSASWGDLLGSSYLNASITAGTFFNQASGLPEQGAINMRLNFFSPLFNIGSWHVRQFLYSSGTWGLNRLWGEREQIAYNSYARVRGMGASMANFGSNRLTLGGETVLFTPIFLYHFRFAFYVWGDIGILSFDPNVFKGEIASAVGIGVRIKNERLIFNNIQLRLGFSLRRPEHMGYEMFSVSDEEVWRLNPYRPEVPQIVPYD